MKSAIVFVLLLGFAGSAPADEPPDLEILQEILRRAYQTPPGEELEDLAEQASRYVRRSPEAFLSAQMGQPRCFGVRFLGADFVDQPAKRAREISARRKALGSVSDPGLAQAKARCLAELADRR